MGFDKMSGRLIKISPPALVSMCSLIIPLNLSYANMCTRLPLLFHRNYAQFIMAYCFSDVYYEVKTKETLMRIQKPTKYQALKSQIF
jgi:hypothetical protein